MTALREMKKQAIEVVERRAFEARITMSAVCARANVSRQTWANAKSRGTVGVDTLSTIEKALAEMEAEKVA